MNIFKKSAVLCVSTLLLAFIAEAQQITTGPVAGRIVKESKTAIFHFLVLSNGMKVMILPDNQEPGMTYFSIVSPGGTSFYNDADYASAEQAATMIRIGGAGKLDAQALSKYLQGKKVSVNPFIVGRSEGLNCRASNEDLLTALELANAYFTAPRKDEAAFKRIIDNAKSEFKAPQKTEEELIRDSINLIKANQNKRFTGQNPLERLDQVNLDKCFQIFKERFADAADFTAIFIGNVNIETLKPMLEKYLAGLTATHSNEQVKDLGIYMIKQQTDKTFFVKNAVDAKVQLYYAGVFPFSKKNELVRAALVNEIQARLGRRLKTIDPEVKNLKLDENTIKTGVSYYNISIEFNCLPAKVSQLTAAVKEELAAIPNEGSESSTLAAFKTAAITKNKAEGTTMNYLKQEILKGLSVAEIENFEVTMNSISAADIKNAAKTYLSSKNCSRFIILPLK